MPLIAGAALILLACVVLVLMYLADPPALVVANIENDSGKRLEHGRYEFNGTVRPLSPPLNAIAFPGSARGVVMRGGEGSVEIIYDLGSCGEQRIQTEGYTTSGFKFESRVAAASCGLILVGHSVSPIGLFARHRARKPEPRP